VREIHMGQVCTEVQEVDGGTEGGARMSTKAERLELGLKIKNDPEFIEMNNTLCANSRFVAATERAAAAMLKLGPRPSMREIDAIAISDPDAYTIISSILHACPSREMLDRFLREIEAVAGLHLARHRHRCGA